MSTAVDLALLALILISFAVGAFRGLRREAVRFGAIVISIVGAILCRGLTEELLVRFADLNFLFAAVLAFPATLIAFYLVTGIAAGILDRRLASDRPGYDGRIFGAFFGFGRGLLSATIISAILAAYPLPGDKIGKSRFVAAARELGLGRFKAMSGPLGDALPMLSEIAGDPETTARFLRSPEMQSIVGSPEARQLMEDPEIRAILQSRDMKGLLSHPKFDRLMRDRAFIDRIMATNIAEAIRRARE